MSAYSNNRGSKLFRKAIPSLPDFGSLELIEKRGPHPAESNITELMGVTSSLMQLLYHVTKLHKGIATKVCFLGLYNLIWWLWGGEKGGGGEEEGRDWPISFPFCVPFSNLTRKKKL